MNLFSKVLVSGWLGFSFVAFFFFGNVILVNYLACEERIMTMRVSLVYERERGITECVFLLKLLLIGLVL